MDPPARKPKRSLRATISAVESSGNGSCPPRPHVQASTRPAQKGLGTGACLCRGGSCWTGPLFPSERAVAATGAPRVPPPLRGYDVTALSASTYDLTAVPPLMSVRSRVCFGDGKAVGLGTCWQSRSLFVLRLQIQKGIL